MGAPARACIVRVRGDARTCQQSACMRMVACIAGFPEMKEHLFEHSRLGFYSALVGSLLILLAQSWQVWAQAHTFAEAPLPQAHTCLPQAHTPLSVAQAHTCWSPAAVGSWAHTNTYNIIHTYIHTILMQMGSSAHLLEPPCRASYTPCRCALCPHPPGWSVHLGVLPAQAVVLRGSAPQLADCLADCHLHTAPTLAEPD